MTRSTYLRKRRDIMEQLADLNAQLTNLNAQTIDAPAPRTTRRVPQWCKPWWQRRDGIQHIVYCTAKRKRDSEPSTAYWLWLNGEPKAKSNTMAGIKQLAHIRSMLYATYVWNAEQWEEHMREHPEIAQKLKELEG